MCEQVESAERAQNISEVLGAEWKGRVNAAPCAG